MKLVKVEINLTQKKPVALAMFPIVKDTQKMVYYAEGKKKTPSALARASLGKPILVTPVRGHCFVISFHDDRGNAEVCRAVTEEKMELLAEMENAMQRCAVRLNEQMEELYALMEG